MQHHYFIGIALPDELSQAVFALQMKLYDDRRMLHPLVPHITLLAPWTVANLEPRQFGTAAGRATNELLPLTLALSQLDTFGRRVIFIHAENDMLQELRSRLIALLPSETRAKLLKKEAAFTPHLTLAQAKFGKKIPESTHLTYQSAVGKLFPAVFNVRHLTLFQRESPRVYFPKSL